MLDRSLGAVFLTVQVDGIQRKKEKLLMAGY